MSDQTQPKMVDAYFDRQIGDVADIVSSLRALVLDCGPALEEHLAWGFPSYKGNERILSICVQTGGYVNVQLFNGVGLAPLSDRIEGTGKSLRHVKVRCTDEIDEDLRKIITAAVVLDQTVPHKVR